MGCGCGKGYWRVGVFGLGLEGWIECFRWGICFNNKKEYEFDLLVVLVVGGKNVVENRYLGGRGFILIVVGDLCFRVYFIFDCYILVDEK